MCSGFKIVTSIYLVKVLVSNPSKPICGLVGTMRLSEKIDVAAEMLKIFLGL